MAWSKAAGAPTYADDDVLMSDLGLPASLPPNNATLLRPVTDASNPVIGRVREFFRGPGGGYQIWSIWPLPPFADEGFRSWTAPCMVREAGGPPPEPPPELSIARVADATALDEASAIVGAVFGGLPGGPDVMAPALLDDPAVTVCLGRVDGVPVTTAMSYESDGYIGVYAVATIPEYRGRGYGEAITWAGIARRPDLPATLQASPMGRPVYKRMGFETVGEFTVWERTSR